MIIAELQICNVMEHVLIDPWSEICDKAAHFL